MADFRFFIEADEEHIDSLLSFWNAKDDAIDPNKLPFGNLFGSKYRLITPIKYSPNFKLVEILLRRAGYITDWSRGMAYYKVPQQGRPDKMGAIDFGKALAKVGKKIKHNADISGLQRWVSLLYTYDVNPQASELQKQEAKKAHARQVYTQASAALSENKMVAIISRHPIDILRMSDFDHYQGTVDKSDPHITSCHSLDGMHANAAKLESKYGGGIAYLVKANDLKGIRPNENEIFKDRQRNVSGIAPVARIRLRRFTSKDKTINILLPDLKVYGDDAAANSVDFKGWIINWAKQTQKSTIQQIKDKKLTLKDFVLRGGYYQDHGQDSNIWNRIVEPNVPAVGDAGAYGFVQEKDDPDYTESNRFEIYQREMRQFHEIYNKKGGRFTHYPNIKTIWDIAENEYHDGDVQLSWHAHITITIPQDELSSQFKSYIVSPLKEKETMHDKYDRISLRLDTLETKELKAQIKKFNSTKKIKNLKIVHSLGGWAQRQENPIGNVAVEFEVEGMKEDDMGEPLNPDYYEEFMSEIQSLYDQNYETFQAVAQHWLSKQILKGIGPAVKAPLSFQFGQSQFRQAEKEGMAIEAEKKGEIPPEVKYRLRNFFPDVADPEELEDVEVPIFKAQKIIRLEFNIPLFSEIKDKLKQAWSSGGGWHPSVLDEVLTPKTNEILLQSLQTPVQQQLLLWGKPPSLKQTHWMLPEIEWKAYDSSINPRQVDLTCKLSFNIYLKDSKQNIQGKYLTLLKLDKIWNIFESKVTAMATSEFQQLIKRFTGQPWWYEKQSSKIPAYMNVFTKRPMPLFPTD